ncbi:caspase family protein [Actinoplanes sp. CA-054009]
MPKIYALLVGIDRYRVPGLRLRGCVNDVRLAEHLLRDRVEADRLAVETLCDTQATRAAVIDRFRRHLGAAGDGDIALFWFSGHGSTAELPKQMWYAENAAACQTIVCHDSRAGAPDLYDKELAILARDVVAGGAQLVTILDSCHSRSGMREIPATGLSVRAAPPPDDAPHAAELLSGLAGTAGGQIAGHIALSACDEHEEANESVFPAGVHGVFSEAIGHAMTRLGPYATYRQVLGDARCRVAGRFRRQRPGLEWVGDLADREFLGGALRPRASRITMRRGRGAWEVDAGAVHSVAVSSRFAVHRAETLREVRVTEVFLDRSRVEPVGWKPDAGQSYDMVPTEVPLPPVSVSIHARPSIAARLQRRAQPSPHIRVIDPGREPGGRLLLRVREDDGTLQITSADHEPLAPAAGEDEQGVEQTVRDLEHVARWLQVRNLSSPSPALQDAVRMEIVPAAPGGARPPRDAEPVTGDLEFDYRFDDGVWTPPSVHIRLRNTTSARLYCALLDLTDRFRIHPGLFRGDFIAPHWTADVGRGHPVPLSLPPGRVVEPGAAVTDWLVLLVAEEPFDSEPFSLPRLREVAAGEPRRSRTGITGIVGRLGLLTARRDVELSPDTAADWAVTVTEIRTRVPR